MNIELHEPDEFVNCAANASLNLNFKHLNTVDAYKQYLNARWSTDKITPRWTNSVRPF